MRHRTEIQRGKFETGQKLPSKKKKAKRGFRNKNESLFQQQKNIKNSLCLVQIIVRGTKKKKNKNTRKTKSRMQITLSMKFAILKFA